MAISEYANGEGFKILITVLKDNQMQSLGLGGFTFMLEKITNLYGVDYLVREDGKIFSTSILDDDGNPKEIKQRVDRDGYKTVTVGLTHNRKSIRVHRIIASTFIPNEDKTLEVDHIDHNKINNNVNNLRWITHFENASRIPFERRSKSHKGEKNGRAELNEEDVFVIKRMYNDGISIAEIAREFDRGWTTISHVINGDTWK